MHQVELIQEDLVIAGEKIKKEKTAVPENNMDQQVSRISVQSYYQLIQGDYPGNSILKVKTYVPAYGKFLKVFRLIPVGSTF